MIAFAQRIGDMVIEADAANHLATVRVLMHSSAPETVQQLERALALAQQSGNQEIICRTLWNFGLAYRFEDPPRAAEYLDRALAMAREANLDELIAFCLIDLMGRCG
jgi:putative ribosome biogenesis GTPase RsgA